VAKVHHSAIVTRDIEVSFTFWRERMGFDVLMDETFEGPWPGPFDWKSTTCCRSFSVRPARECGIVELAPDRTWRR
jgi:catechol 2,3-dioxygenase-like lactoylglutathione lyase family enzyme